jgi:hypothetical protein
MMDAASRCGAGGPPEKPDAGTRVQRCPACVDCEAKRDDVGPPNISWNRIEQLQTAAEVANYPGLTSSTNLGHIADADGILRRYDLPEDARCSFGHHHKQGIVVQMLCGIVLCMGFDCGENTIIGFSAIRQQFKRRVQFEADRMRLSSWAKRYRETIRLLKPHLDARLEVYNAILHALPELHAELKRRERLAARGLEVSGHAGQLVGLAIVNAPKYGAAKLRDVCSEFEALYGDRPPEDGDKAAALNTTARRGDRLVDDARRWILETHPFVSEANLVRALATLQRPSAAVKRTARGWRLSHFGSGLGAEVIDLPDVRQLLQS